MTLGTHKTRKGLAVVAALTVSAFTAPAALADPPQGHRAVQRDLVERWVDGRAGTGQPDLVERYVASRATSVARDDPDGYQPQLRTASAASSVAAPSGNGFAWGDAGIGALAGFVFSLIAAGALLTVRGRARLAHS